MESFGCPIKDYLMVWIGLVGGCVGLWIPSEMARDEKEDQ
jgi:ubiquitin-like-conjugating enzyme ATG10